MNTCHLYKGPIITVPKRTKQLSKVQCHITNRFHILSLFSYDPKSGSIKNTEEQSQTLSSQSQNSTQFRWIGESSQRFEAESSSLNSNHCNSSTSSKNLYDHSGEEEELKKDSNQRRRRGNLPVHFSVRSNKSPTRNSKKIHEDFLRLLIRISR
jgi:uncharacterized protein YukE